MITKLKEKLQAETQARPAESKKTIDDGVQQRIESLHAEGKLDAMRDFAFLMHHRNRQLDQRFSELSTIQQKLQEEIGLLLSPEHHVVTICANPCDQDRTVQVAGSNGGRTLVGVHPEVDFAELTVGATAILTRERNCLIKVIARSTPWRHVVTFESVLDTPDRILVRDRESMLAVGVAETLRGQSLSKGDLVGIDRDGSGLAFTRVEPAIADDLFDENADDSFDVLGGLDHQIDRLKEIIDFRIRFPDLANKYSIEDRYGILLHGAPGNGKTHLARCCAGYARQLFPDQECRFMHVAGASDYSMWLGESERQLIARFDAIRESAREGLVIAFWDEIDALAKLRGSDLGSSAPDRILNTFLAQLDGVIPLQNVVMIFATNRQDTLDPGFIRAGRIDEKIEIPTPNRRAAHAIVQRYLNCDLPLVDGDAESLTKSMLSRLFAHNGDYAVVAEVKLADGRQLPVAGRELISGAMLKKVVRGSARIAAVREARTGREGVAADDLCQVLNSELVATVAMLAPVNVKSYVASIPQDAQPIAVHDLLTTSSHPRVPR